MKYLYLVIFLATFFVAESYAQKPEFGLKAGLNLANLSGVSSGVDAKIKPGVNLGVYGHIPITNQIYYFPELVFSSLGSKYSYFQSASSTAVVGNTTLNLNYLNLLPLSVKLYVSKSKALNLIARPQLGILVSAKAEGEIYGDPVNEDIKEEMNVMDIGLMIGLGYDTSFGLNIGGKYQHGLSNIDKNKTDIWGNELPPLTNRVIQFYLGYAF